MWTQKAPLCTSESAAVVVVVVVAPVFFQTAVQDHAES